MVLITMAGLSSRFRKAGYDKPKYALLYKNRTIFEWAVCSFERYFHSEPFLFIVRPDGFARNFVQNSVQALNIKNYSIFELTDDTRGQAETAYKALQAYKVDFPVLIFNVDTIIHDYVKPVFIEECDGYLEVFEGEGEHWSFVKPGENLKVLETREKERISNLCSDGLYYFRSQLDFKRIFEECLLNNEMVRGEYYIAPLYNKLIKEGKNVKYDMIDPHNISFCGTPEEYEALIRNGMPS